MTDKKPTNTRKKKKITPKMVEKVVKTTVARRKKIVPTCVRVSFPEIAELQGPRGGDATKATQIIAPLIKIEQNLLAIRIESSQEIVKVDRYIGDAFTQGNLVTIELLTNDLQVIRSTNATVENWKISVKPIENPVDPKDKFFKTAYVVFQIGQEEARNPIYGLADNESYRYKNGSYLWLQSVLEQSVDPLVTKPVPERVVQVAVSNEALEEAAQRYQQIEDVFTGNKKEKAPEQIIPHEGLPIINSKLHAIFCKVAFETYGWFDLWATAKDKIQVKLERNDLPFALKLTERVVGKQTVVVTLVDRFGTRATNRAVFKEGVQADVYQDELRISSVNLSELNSWQNTMIKVDGEFKPRYYLLTLDLETKK